MLDAFAMCPHCGFNLRREAHSVIGALDFDPYAAVFWRGRRVHLTAAEKILLGSLVAEHGYPVMTDALLLRMGSDSEFNVVQVMVHRLREKLAVELIETVRSRGYRLNVEFAESAALELA